MFAIQSSNSCIVHQRQADLNPCQVDQDMKLCEASSGGIHTGSGKTVEIRMEAIDRVSLIHNYRWCRFNFTHCGPELFFLADSRAVTLGFVALGTFQLELPAKILFLWVIDPGVIRTDQSIDNGVLDTFKLIQRQ